MHMYARLCLCATATRAAAAVAAPANFENRYINQKMHRIHKNGRCGWQH